jgi:hypothetical protein
VPNLPTEPQQRPVTQSTSRPPGPTGTLVAPGDQGPTSAPAAHAQDLRAPAPRRRLVIGLLSVATAIWLAAQLAAGFAMNVHTWPVAGFPMFSEKRAVVSDRRIEARTRSGGRQVVKPGDFGLTDLQFLNYQRGMVSEAGMVKPMANARLGRLAAIWNRQHPNDPAVSMTQTHVVYPLPHGTPESLRQVIRWSAS